MRPSLNQVHRRADSNTLRGPDPHGGDRYCCDDSGLSWKETMTSRYLCTEARLRDPLLGAVGRAALHWDHCTLCLCQHCATAGMS
jgi:hypothetical protein